jgi:hypothetical protein
VGRYQQHYRPGIVCRFHCRADSGPANDQLLSQRFHRIDFCPPLSDVPPVARVTAATYGYPAAALDVDGIRTACLDGAGGYRYSAGTGYPDPGAGNILDGAPRDLIAHHTGEVDVADLRRRRHRVGLDHIRSMAPGDVYGAALERVGGDYDVVHPVTASGPELDSIAASNELVARYR